MSMTKGPRMFRSFSGSWNFKEPSSGITEVTFLYSFRFTFPYSMVGFFIKNYLRRNIAARLKDLKNCLEKS
jgi:ribosome-associated toxin RatA of RatAB toxin-antitoxin module